MILTVNSDYLHFRNQFNGRLNFAAVSRLIYKVLPNISTRPIFPSDSSSERFPAVDSAEND
jgi:hypothetical protein